MEIGCPHGVLVSLIKECKNEFNGSSQTPDFTPSPGWGGGAQGRKAVNVSSSSQEENGREGQSRGVCSTLAWWSDTGQIATGRREALERIRKPGVPEKANLCSDQL